MCVLTERPDLVLAGVGNRYRTDDAVGLQLVEQYRLRGDSSVATELWDDFDGAAVAHRLVELACPVLIVDCAELALPGGGHRVLEGEKIQRATVRNVVSTHGIGVAEGVQLAGVLGYAQPLWLFGVQPFVIDMGETLSPPMAAILPDLQRDLSGVVAKLARQERRDG